MAKKTEITQEKLISKFRNIDLSEVYELTKRSDQILWTLFKIKTSFKIEEFIATSVLLAILVDSIGISVTAKNITNALNPIRDKIHRQVIGGEISYKIMQKGASRIQKLIQKGEPKAKKVTQKGEPKAKKVTQKSKQKERESGFRQAITTVRKLGQQESLQPGLYYVVLIDLIGSTIASAKMTPEVNKKRIKQFINFTKTALPTNPRNYSKFLKDIGDASLFLFTNFKDILEWSNRIDELCDEYNQKCITENKPEIFQMFSKRCVHLGEVHFDDDYDPIAFVINQISKIEKEFEKDQLGITENVYQVILPRIDSGQLTASVLKKIKLPGEKIARPLYTIAYSS